MLIHRIPASVASWTNGRQIKVHRPLLHRQAARVRSTWSLRLRQALSRHIITYHPGILACPLRHPLLSKPKPRLSNVYDHLRQLDSFKTPRRQDRHRHQHRRHRLLLLRIHQYRSETFSARYFQLSTRSMMVRETG